jgi:hypothetical protein
MGEQGSEGADRGRFAGAGVPEYEDSADRPADGSGEQRQLHLFSACHGCEREYLTGRLRAPSVNID